MLFQCMFTFHNSVCQPCAQPKLADQPILIVVRKVFFDELFVELGHVHTQQAEKYLEVRLLLQPDQGFGFYLSELVEAHTLIIVRSGDTI